MYKSCDYKTNYIRNIFINSDNDFKKTKFTKRKNNKNCDKKTKNLF